MRWTFILVTRRTQDRIRRIALAILLPNPYVSPPLIERTQGINPGFFQFVAGTGFEPVTSGL
jgi:hypothetical protein